MQVFGKIMGRVLLVVLGFVLVIWLGPREQVETRASGGDVPTISGLEDWLADSEAAVPNLRVGSEKQVVWAGAAGAQTALSVVYLHGFSADREEVRPLPDEFADALGANLFYTRLQGHGRDGAAMAEPRAGDWIADLDEALAIGRLIGERVLVIGTSTGGTLAAWAATDPDKARVEDVAGMVLISPNFEIGNPAGRLLTWPFVRVWGPWVAGAERSFEPLNAQQAAHWTTRYPMVATLPMATLVEQVRQRDFATAMVPALILFSDEDQVVSAGRTREIAASWAGPVTLVPMDTGDGIDPSAHVLAGDIASPAGTAVALAAMMDWVDGLGVR